MIRFFNRLAGPLTVLAILAATSLVTVDHAEARRGGSFGSRGARTYSAPPVTATAPTAVPPVQRSMTPQTVTPQAEMPRAAPASGSMMPQQRPGLFGGMFGGILGGLALGGLIGMLFGHGFGGLTGAFGMILQCALLAMGAMLLFRMFGNRRVAEPVPAAVPFSSQVNPEAGVRPMAPAGFGLGSHPLDAPPQPVNGRNAHDEIGIEDSDLDTFERMLGEVQSAFAREDYAGLRALSTPEIVSYLSEELAENATRGLRNEVSRVRLLQGDLAEAWREGEQDYATVAMRYESCDVMRERASGRVVSGDPEAVTETRELWTFTRRVGGAWKLSAIQET